MAYAVLTIFPPLQLHASMNPSKDRFLPYSNVFPFPRLIIHRPLRESYPEN